METVCLATSKGMLKNKSNKGMLKNNQTFLSAFSLKISSQTYFKSLKIITLLCKVGIM